MSNADDSRLYFLDLVRFFACLWVLIWHYQHFFYVSAGVLPIAWNREVQPFYSLLSCFYNSCKGVQVFWMLSGFVFLWFYRSRIQCGQVGCWRFFVNRFSRLYPLIFITTLCVYGIQIISVHYYGVPFIYPHNGVGDLIRNLLCVPYIVTNPGLSLNNPVWSVTIEILFYSLFFVMVKFRLLNLPCCLVAVVLFKIGIIPIQAETSVNHWMEFRAVAVNSCGVWFFGGCALGCVLELFKLKVPNCGAKVGAFMYHLGNISFGAYLWHVPVQIGILMVSKRYGGNPQSGWFFGVFLASTFAMANLSYYVIEKPLQLWLRKHLIKR